MEEGKEWEDENGAAIFILPTPHNPFYQAAGLFDRREKSYCFKDANP